MKFTGQERDFCCDGAGDYSDNLDDGQYSPTQGRSHSVDSGADPQTPQTWNAYALESKKSLKPGTTCEPGQEIKPDGCVANVETEAPVVDPFKPGSPLFRWFAFPIGGPGGSPGGGGSSPGTGNDPDKDNPADPKKSDPPNPQDPDFEEFLRILRTIWHVYTDCILPIQIAWTIWKTVVGVCGGASPTVVGTAACLAAIDGAVVLTLGSSYWFAEHCVKGRPWKGGH